MAVVIFAHLFQPASNTPTDVSALESSISALERAISALESEVKALESRSVSWEHSVWVFTLMVVVGVALELWVIRHDWRDEMETWALGHFGIVRHPGRPSLLKLRIEIASVLLITLGVAGELVTGIEISSINGELRGKSAELRSNNAELRSKSDQLLALVTQQAGTAADSAQKAQDAARQAWEYAAWRKISDKQEGVILKRLGITLKGHELIVFRFEDDSELDAFAERIAAVLNEAMHVTGAAWPDKGITTPPGMTFFVGKNRESDFSLIVEALDLAGVAKAATLRKAAQHGVRVTDNQLILHVGARH